MLPTFKMRGKNTQFGKKSKKELKFLKGNYGNRAC